MEEEGNFWSYLRHGDSNAGIDEYEVRPSLECVARELAEQYGEILSGKLTISRIKSPPDDIGTYSFYYKIVEERPEKFLGFIDTIKKREILTVNDAIYELPYPSDIKYMQFFLHDPFSEDKKAEDIVERCFREYFLKHGVNSIKWYTYAIPPMPLAQKTSMIQAHAEQ